MTNTTTRQFEAEIRDIQNHDSDTMGGDADVNVVEDTLHSERRRQVFDDSRALRVYLTNTHNELFDVEVHHAEPATPGYDHTITAATVTLATGASATATIDGPVGDLRLRVLTGALASPPTDGSLRATVVSTN